MVVPAVISHGLSWWAEAYSDHRLLAVTVRFLHIAALMVGGGTAMAMDGKVLRAATSGADVRLQVLTSLASAHRVVVPSLVLVVATGVLMTASDTSTFFGSPVYWTKLALVALLLVNGYGLVVAERLARRGHAWRRLAVGSAASLVLWFLTLFVGTLLTAAA